MIPHTLNEQMDKLSEFLEMIDEAVSGLNRQIVGVHEGIEDVQAVLDELASRGFDREVLALEDAASGAWIEFMREAHEEDATKGEDETPLLR